jgi:NhaA family Na+:H+ antiporter
MSKHKNNNKLSPTNILAFMLQEERRSGVLLLIAALAALFLANSVWSHIYFGFIEKQLTFGSITLDIQHWISEGLMALFFLVVTLEVKREFIDGELKGWKKASFPFIAAIGGMVVPAFIYLFLNQTPPESSGWGVPIATDIAIAIGILALLGNKIPRNLRIFLLALAIIDDIGSILVIALFYSQPTNIMALLGALALSFSLITFQKQKLWALSYSLIGILIWYLLVIAGISGTLAGVILAVMAPLTTQRQKNAPSLQLSEKIEDLLLPITAYFIVPLFVFSSAGLNISSLVITKDTGLTVFMGVSLGLMFGKPLGIFIASWLAAKLRMAKKPQDLRWSHIAGVGFIAGIGFTISLLIADLSFESHPDLENAAIVGVFVASLLSAVLGLLILELSQKRKTTRIGR